MKMRNHIQSIITSVYIPSKLLRLVKFPLKISREKEKSIVAIFQLYFFFKKASIFSFAFSLKVVNELNKYHPSSCFSLE